MNNLKPKEWCYDYSAHKYKIHGKTITGYEWEAVDATGSYKRGVARKQADAELRAKQWAKNSIT